jgi:hypothetical protein
MTITITKGTTVLELRDRLYDALEFGVDELGEGDASGIVHEILEGVIAVLRRDPRMPKLSLLEWELLLADVGARCTENVTELIDGKVDLRDTVRAIADGLAEE